jgi:hypothetical protein
MADTNNQTTELEALAKQKFSEGWSLYQQGNLTGATKCYLEAAAIKPGWYEPQYHLAVCAQHKRDYVTAIGHYLGAIALKPDVPILNYHAAKCLKDSGHLAAATALYAKALHLQPDFADAKYSLGLLEFLKGNWQGGWKGYGLRLEGSDRADKEYRTETAGLAKWRGEAIPKDSKLLVTCEQGMGDVLMCFRFVPLLKQLFGNVGFTVHAPLVELCQSNVPEGVEVIRWVKAPAPIEYYTHTIHLMDLPAAFGATPENIPNSPYIKAASTNNRELAEVLNGLSTSQKIKIGVVWQGGKVSVANGRDMPFEQMLPMLQDPYLNERVQWVSLQKDIKVDGLPYFLNAMLPVQNFADTAALVEKLDLVISVDTAVAHLAGAMGKPVWLLNRFESEWRWMHGKSTTPWYPSMRIFNEPRPGEWPSVIREISQTLKMNLSNVRGDQ